MNILQKLDLETLKYYKFEATCELLNQTSVHLDKNQDDLSDSEWDFRVQLIDLCKIIANKYDEE